MRLLRPRFPDGARRFAALARPSEDRSTASESLPVRCMSAHRQRVARVAKAGGGRAAAAKGLNIQLPNVHQPQDKSFRAMVSTEKYFMRKVLIGLLLAGAAATPAFAGPHIWSDRASASQDRQSAQEDRSQAREERAQAREDNSQARDEQRSQRAERPSFAPQQQQILCSSAKRSRRPPGECRCDAR